MIKLLCEIFLTSYQLKTPITSIRIQTELLLEEKDNLIKLREVIREYIKDKTIFVKKVSVKPGSYAGKENAADGINYITCTAEWPFKLDFFGINIGNISMSREVYRNHSEQIIRKTNIMLHK